MSRFSFGGGGYLAENKSNTISDYNQERRIETRGRLGDAKRELNTAQVNLRKALTTNDMSKVSVALQRVNTLVEEIKSLIETIGRYSFGYRHRKTKRRKTKRHSKKKNSKPPAALLKKCRKYKIKITKKVGNKRVYKKISVLKKQLARKIRKLRRSRK